MMDGYQSTGTKNYHVGVGNTTYSAVSVSVFVGLYLAEFVHCQLKLKLNTLILSRPKAR